MVVVARRVALTLVLRGRCTELPRAPHQLGGQPPPMGIQAVDVADEPAAHALCPGERTRPMRRRRMCPRADAHRLTGDVVVVGADAALGRCGRGSCDATGATPRSSPPTPPATCVVHRTRPSDVLLLRDRARAVPGDGIGIGLRGHPARIATRRAGHQTGETGARGHRRRPLCGARRRQLRLAVADPDRLPHLADDVAAGDLVASWG